MSNHTHRRAIQRSLLKTGGSLAAIGVALFTCSQALAQDASQSSDQPVKTNGEVKEVVVVGQRAALKSAQRIKQTSDTIVDSITATDIGAFPDLSVAEALQRVAGITVDRFAANSDTAHFSAEPSGVLVRGLEAVRNEFNGRDSFDANSSRGLGWADVSPELMAGVDTYKNQTADMIEGGIAGTVDLRTRVPFDSSGRLLSASIQGTYNVLSQSARPDVVVLGSDRWNTPWGEFGFLADYAYSSTLTGAPGIQFSRMGIFGNPVNPTCTTIDCAFNPVYGSTNVGPGNLEFIPSNVNYHDTEYDRVRQGGAYAAQWRSPDHKLLVTFQLNTSEYWEQMREYVVDPSPFGNASGTSLFQKPVNFVVNNSTGQAPQPAPGTPDFVFSQGGNFESGVMTEPIGWWGANNAASSNFAQNAAGVQMVNACYGWNGCTPTQQGSDLQDVTRSGTNTNFTEDASFNVKWNPTDRLKLNLDVQRVHSKVKNWDMEVDMNSFANFGLNTSGFLPKTCLMPPVNTNLSPGPTVNLSSVCNGLAPAGMTSEQDYWANPDNYSYHALMDHLEYSTGDETAVRADGQWMFQTDWLDSVKFGYRYADRQQNVDWSTYNWENVANNWSNNYPWYNIDRGAFNGTVAGTQVNFKGYPTNSYVTRSFGNNGIFGGNVIFPNKFVFMNMSLVSNQTLLDKEFANINLGSINGAPGVGNWVPICYGDQVDAINQQRIANNEAPISNPRSGETGPGNCFLPSEITALDETTDAAYGMLKFGGPNAKLGSIGISGNIGLRWVYTDDESKGSISTPSQQSTLQSQTSGTHCTVATPNPNPGQPYVPFPAACYLTAGQLSFLDGGAIYGTAKNTSSIFLPSFNLKAQLSKTWVMRLAYSRAMSRPDMGNLKYYESVGGSLPGQSDYTNSEWVYNKSGCNQAPQPSGCQVIGVSPYFTGSSQNPDLKPIQADNYDITFENYFASVGFVAVDFFYKRYYNYIQIGSFNQILSINGSTQTIALDLPVNKNGGSVKGMEFSFQRYFDFLPKPFDGLGIQANFTTLQDNGILSSNVSNTGAAADPQNQGLTESQNLVKVNALENFSKTSYNVIGMYEKGPWAFRLAYSWRDKFLVTNSDCCVVLPIWQMPQGLLDASLRYKVNSHIELDVQGTNLLNTWTVLKQQVTDYNDPKYGMLLEPNAIFQNDQRIMAGIRIKY